MKKAAHGRPFLVGGYQNLVVPPIQRMLGTAVLVEPQVVELGADVKPGFGNGTSLKSPGANHRNMCG